MKNQISKEGRRQTRFPKDLKGMVLPVFFACSGLLTPLQAGNFSWAAPVKPSESAKTITIEMLQQTALEGTVKEVHQMPGRNYNVKAGCMDYLGIMGLVENNAKFEN